MRFSSRWLRPTKSIYLWRSFFWISSIRIEFVSTMTIFLQMYRQCNSWFATSIICAACICLYLFDLCQNFFRLHWFYLCRNDTYIIIVILDYRIAFHYIAAFTKTASVKYSGYCFCTFWYEIQLYIVLHDSVLQQTLPVTTFYFKSTPFARLCNLKCVAFTLDFHCIQFAQLCNWP